MPPDRSRPRQDPVSCQLCRSKKLKCDRQRPCSNCASRKLACEYRSEGPPILAPADTPRLFGDESFDSLRAENRSIKARLQKLEQAVFGGNSMSNEVHGVTAEDYPSTSTAASTRLQPQQKPRTAADKAHEDSIWLESIGTRNEIALPQLTDTFLVNLQTLDQFYIADQKPPQLRRIDLPTHEIAKTALQAYAEHLDAVQHIMHVDGVHAVIDGVYAQILAGHRPDPGAIALILAICANVGFYWTVGFHRGTSLFEDSVSATKVSMEWTKQALYAMEQARIATSATSLEVIQASIMLLFLLYHLEGFTSRVRLMHVTAISVARSMGLHNLDAPSHSVVDFTQSAIIELEVKRKIWWHLSCTDWLLSFLGGPSEGMCIHPRQMHVKLPRNLTREDLNTQGPDFSRSISEPTIMSYYLQRIKMASTCREIADALWSDSDIESVDYDVVHTLDSKFEMQIQEFPRFLRIDIPSKQLREEYGDAYDQQIDVQGAMVNLMIHTRRCKLHLRYLIRAKQNPRFAFSRRIGLQSARAVFSVRSFAMNDESSMCANHLKLGGMLQHIFFAIVVLVMDLCTNNPDDPEQLAEVREALLMMQESKEPSGRGAKFYESLMAVLRKHHVKLPNLERRRNVAGTLDVTITPEAQNGTRDRLMLTTHSSDIWTSSFPSTQPTELGMSQPDATDGFNLDNGMWQDFLDQGQTLDPQDWEALMTDLDMRMM